MPFARVSAKGQITLPASVRRALALQPGDRVTFVMVEPNCVEMIAAVRSARELKGLFGKAAHTVPLASMNPGSPQKGPSR